MIFLKRASAILTGTYIGKTYTEYQNEFVEHFPDGKHIGNILDIKTRKNVTGPQNTFCGSGICKYLETRFQILKDSKKNLNFAHDISVHNGCDPFPNELMRFRIEAKAIWKKIKKH